MPAPVLVILMGVPGSGKSTVAAQLVRDKSSNDSVYVVSYDDLFDEIAAGAAGRRGQEDSAGSSNFDVDSWHASRQEALGRSAVLLQVASDEARKRSSVGKAGKSSKKGKKVAVDEPPAAIAVDSTHRLVVLDDTFEYRSMRREARKVARQVSDHCARFQSTIWT